MHYVVTNLPTTRGSRVGLQLQDTLHGVIVVALDAFPNEIVRTQVQPGDRIVSVAGVAARSARAVAKRLKSSNGTVSVCLLRRE